MNLGSLPTPALARALGHTEQEVAALPHGSRIGPAGSLLLLRTAYSEVRGLVWIAAYGEAPAPLPPAAPSTSSSSTEPAVEEVVAVGVML